MLAEGMRERGFPRFASPATEPGRRLEKLSAVVDQGNQGHRDVKKLPHQARQPVKTLLRIRIEQLQIPQGVQPGGIVEGKGNWIHQLLNGKEPPRPPKQKRGETQKYRTG